MSVRDDDMALPGVLDPWTADRLLDGLVAPEDAPPGYAGVARLVIAARRPPSSEELAGMDLAIAAAVSLLHDDGVDADRIATRMRRAQRLVKAKVSALVVVGTIVGTSGLAAANALPAPMQNVASHVLDAVGIHVPAHGDGADHLSTMFALPSPNASPTAVTSRGHGHDGDDTTTEPRDGTGGRSVSPHGASDESHGASDEPHGQDDQPHGQSDAPHGTDQTDHPDHPSGQPTDPGSQGGGNHPTDPGSQGGGNHPTDPGSQGGGDHPTDPGSQGGGNQPTDPGSQGGDGNGSKPTEPPGQPTDPGRSDGAGQDRGQGDEHGGGQGSGPTGLHR